jgi:hypothetical protein
LSISTVFIAVTPVAVHSEKEMETSYHDHESKATEAVIYGRWEWSIANSEAASNKQCPQEGTKHQPCLETSLKSYRPKFGNDA